MAAPRRIQKINSLLKEVISYVIRLDLKNYSIPELLTVTEVDTSKDLQHAKVYVSLINATPDEENNLIEELQKCASSIAYISSKKVIMRYFPKLTFRIDNSLDEYMKIDNLLKKNKTQQNDLSTDDPSVNEE